MHYCLSLFVDSSLKLGMLSPLLDIVDYTYLLWGFQCCEVLHWVTYCFSSQADLHSSTSRLYISTASSMSTSSHIMCDINSSVFSSSAGLSVFLSLFWGASSYSLLFCEKGFLNCLYGLGLFSCLFLLASTNLSIYTVISVSDSWVRLTNIWL